MSDLDYGTAAADVLRRHVITKRASTLVAEWNAFVEECEECYSWDVSEYNNEIIVRDHLATLLEAPELQHFEEHRELTARVEGVDARFRALLNPEFSLPSARSWWRAGVLRRAGCDYCRFYRDAHGIEIEVCEP